MPQPPPLSVVNMVGRRPLGAFIDRVLAVHARTPLGVTSWWRDPRRNSEAGGDFYSQHLIATAVDVVPLFRGVTVEEIVRAAQAVGLVPVVEDDHVHLQLFPAEANVVRTYFPTLASL